MKSCDSKMPEEQIQYHLSSSHPDVYTLYRRTLMATCFIDSLYFRLALIALFSIPGRIFGNIPSCIRLYMRYGTSKFGSFSVGLSISVQQKLPLTNMEDIVPIGYVCGDLYVRVETFCTILICHSKGKTSILQTTFVLNIR